MSVVLLDTNVFGADLRPGGSELADRYAALISGQAVVISFITVAELEFGALIAGWGSKRRQALRSLIDGVKVVWPGPGLAASYAQLRADCVAAGHGLSERSHEADRWIAATSVFLGVPLVTHDAVFLAAPGLEVLTLAAGA